MLVQLRAPTPDEYSAASGIVAYNTKALIIV
jgi:hypothetical protein